MFDQRLPGGSRRRVVPAVAVAVLAGLLAVALALPGSAHESESIRHNWNRHYKALAQRAFYTKEKANIRFVNVGEQTSAVQWFKAEADSLPATATTERVAFTAPEAITITDVFIEPATALTENDTDYATFTVSRRDSGGGSKVTVASETTQTVGSGGSGDWTAFGVVSMGVLSNTSLAQGQKLTIEIAKAGVGVSLPVLTVQIEYTVG